MTQAPPDAAGVAALIVGRWGHPDAGLLGLTLAPRQTQTVLESTATDHRCPVPRAFHYPGETTPTCDSICVGPADDNGWYGEGVVDALTAVTRR